MPSAQECRSEGELSGSDEEDRVAVAAPGVSRAAAVGDVPSQPGKSNTLISPVDLTDSLRKLLGVGVEGSGTSGGFLRVTRSWLQL